MAERRNESSAASLWPEDGKVFLAANPWPLAAEAKRQGYDTDRFRESDYVPDGEVVIFDLDAFKLPARSFVGLLSEKGK